MVYPHFIPLVEHNKFEQVAKFITKNSQECKHGTFEGELCRVYKYKELELYSCQYTSFIKYGEHIVALMLDVMPFMSSTKEDSLEKIYEYYEKLKAKDTNE